MNQTRVPPRPGFYCRLEDMPDHLVPEPQFRSFVAKRSAGNLRLNPECRVFAAETFRVAFGTDAWLTDGFRVSSEDVIALVRDVGTQAWHPFWLNPEMGRMLEIIGDNGVAFLNPRQRLALWDAGILTSPDYGERQRELWQQTIAHCAPQFAHRGYAPLAGLIHPFHIAALRRYYRQLVRTGTLVLGDAQTPSRHVVHNEVVARFFHHGLTRIFSRIAGEPLKPSYVYLGAYQQGAELKEHVDRAQCEFSITLALDYTPEPVRHTPWPINLRAADGTTTVFQALGDGLLYRGCRLPHSRGLLPTGHSSTSLFFHYVPEDFDGPLD